MQKFLEKYDEYIRLKKPGIIFLLLFSFMLSHAQTTDWRDSVEELKYQVDSINVIDSISSETVDEDYEAEAADSNNKEEYFLRKEFTGGLRDTLQLRRLPDNTIKTLKEDKSFWYADETFKKRQQKDGGADFSVNPVFQTILWLIIIGGFITFLVIYLANSNATLFRKSRRINQEAANPETGDIFSIDYQAEIDKAAAMHNYRLAVRLMFLRLLRDLSERGIIQYKQDSTNFDYMMQLHGAPLYSEFSRLARSYEYSWYGQFEIDKEKYVHIKNAFEKFEYSLTR